MLGTKTLQRWTGKVPIRVLGKGHTRHYSKVFLVLFYRLADRPHVPWYRRVYNKLFIGRSPFASFSGTWLLTVTLCSFSSNTLFYWIVQCRA